MDKLRSLIGLSASQPKQPAQIESDHVYPLHWLDDTKTLRAIVIGLTMRFNDVLDADKLNASLTRLLEIGDWKKIGGRLRLNKDGKLELHVPQAYTSERPAVAFSHQTFEMSIEEHPLAKRLPKSTEAPSIQADPGEFKTFSVKESYPSTLEDFTQHDIPILSLHVTTFSDATLVGLSWPHVLMDVMGRRAIQSAWSQVLNGKESEVPPLLGAREDVVSEAVNNHAAPLEEFALAKIQLKGFSFGIFAVRYLWEMFVNPRVVTHTICLPKKTFDLVLGEARQDLTPKNDPTKEAPFVSEGDVMTAWMARLVASSLPNRPLTVYQALNARFRLPTVRDASGVFVQNMSLAAFTFLKPEDATAPLGQVALENRKELMAQATDGQVMAFLRHLRPPEKPLAEPTSVICGNPHSFFLLFTSWGKAKLFDSIDFSRAVVKAGETGPSRKNPPGSMVYHHVQAVQQNVASTNLVGMLGKDNDGNYWLVGSLRPSAWAKVEEEIKRLS